MAAVSSWTTKEVGNWLRENGFVQYVDSFTTVHQIDGAALLLLTEDDLKQPPMQVRTTSDFVTSVAVHMTTLQFI